jgi:hypothetical protein
MFETRLQRPRPQRDDKILTSWNGLMIGAFARMSRVLDDGWKYQEAARRAALFLRERMWHAGTGVLLRRYRDGHAEIEGYAEDYAFLIAGLLELFQSDADPVWLEWAIALQHRQDQLFWDNDSGGWFSTTGQDASVLVRMKEDYDGAEPTASSVSVMNLLVLSHLVHDPQWTERIERTLRYFGARLEKIGRAVPMMAAALSVYTAGLRQVVIAEAEQDDGAMARAPRVGVPAVCGSPPRPAASAARSGRQLAVCRGDGTGGRHNVRVRVPELHLPPAGDDRRCAAAGVEGRVMTGRMTVDVWLRGTDFATTATIDGSPRPPRSWTDEDVRQVLEAMLRAMDRLKRPGESDRDISLRGLSWIVNHYEEGGVVIAIEISMGAAVAGPFDIDKAALEG